MATCTICHVSKEETFGWWGVTTPPLDKVTLCPRCFRLRSLSDLMVRVLEAVNDSEIPSQYKMTLLYDLQKVSNE